MHRRRRLVALSSALWILACGPSEPKGPTAEEKAAEAKKKEQEAADEAALAARKAKREADEAEKARIEAEITAELERICVTPEKLPKDPVAACEAVGEALDAYMRRIGDEAAIAAWEGSGREKAVPMVVVQCTQADSAASAACQRSAFESASPALKDHTKKIMQLCIDKFAAKKGAPPAGVPKRRPG
ncbi:MAG: hypothetical protein R3B09_26445 [Nannocystaceae bacterium]